MYSLIESRAEIDAAQRKLEATIRREFSRKTVKDIGWQGGRREKATLNTSDRYWYWSADHKQGATNPRRLNWFGVFADGPGVQITVEINTPYEGRNDAIAGFFARNNETGVVYLLHSGRVGGGTTGVSKEAFIAWSAQQLTTVFDSKGKLRNGIVVMPVQGVGATRSLISYVQGVVEFKRAARDGVVSTPEAKERERQLRDYYREASGRRKGKRVAAIIDYVSRHGEVVEALSRWRNALGLARGEKLVKNVLIDLGVNRKGALAEVYEVKTSVARGDVYTAIGQLVVHAPSDHCRRVIVLPADDVLAADLRRALERNHIELKRYRLTVDQVKILA